MGGSTDVTTNQASHHREDEYTLTKADAERFADELARGMASPQDPRLSKAAKPVPLEKIGTPEMRELVARLRAVAAGQRRTGRHKQRRRTLVGLAAPQIGESWRVVLIDTHVDETRRRYGRLECLINPVIVWRSREAAEGREGCFSTGPVWGLVRRPLALKVHAYNEQGKPIERVLENFSARVACHEIDHLDGIRFPERITSDAKRHWVHTEELTDYPERIHAWPRLCSLDRWEQFKRGVI